MTEQGPSGALRLQAEQHAMQWAARVLRKILRSTRFYPPVQRGKGSVWSASFKVFKKASKSATS